MQEIGPFQSFAIFQGLPVHGSLVHQQTDFTICCFSAWVCFRGLIYQDEERVLAKSLVRELGDLRCKDPPPPNGNLLRDSQGSLTHCHCGHSPGFVSLLALLEASLSSGCPPDASDGSSG